MTSLDLSAARDLWDHGAGFLNSGNYGLPPRPAYQALLQAQDEWQRGAVDWSVWTASVDVARTEFGRIIGVPADRIATGAAVSQLLAPIATAVPDGATVLVPDIEFTSVVFPFAVHAGRGVTVRTAPLDEFLAAIVPGIDVVAVAAVQSATGQLVDIPAVVERAHAVGALVVADGTHAAGWHDFAADRVDVGVVAAYKWLCSPRGTAFGWFAADLADRHPRFADRLQPLAAGWYAGPPEDPAYYGMPLRLAADARRFDLSPAWHCWVGAAPALRILADVGPEVIGAHDILLADTLLDRLGLPPRGSAMISLNADDVALQRLRDAGVRFTVRAGGARLGFHLYNDLDDVELAASALV